MLKSTDDALADGMREQALPLSRTLARAAKVLASAVVLAAAVLSVYWAREIALGVPDAYRGEARGSLFLSLGMLSGSAGSLVSKQYWQVVLLVISGACLAASVYFMAPWG